MCFGDFRVLANSRTLMRRDFVVPLGSRAFDLLVVLLRSRGQLVAKEDIVREVWPSTFVDESNLRFQMGVLRKALGSERERIKTIPGRGYLFVGNEVVTAYAEGDQGARSIGSSLAGLSHQSVILIVEPDADERIAMTMLLRALKVSVLSFTSVDEVAAYAISPLAFATN
ncbi:winged helix-turn-helix domain-containing protein (plasmid) [Polymorphobacter sp. PAMC 29334]|nr:winged helix-turn-helix domain-containing protein [Polymorphobacter sp. PAMC 29334]